VVVWDKTHDQIFEFGRAYTEATNNQMELEAAAFALGYLIKRHDDGEGGAAQICSDSKYLLDGMTLHLSKWESQGFLIKNDTIWRDLSAKSKHLLADDRLNLLWTHVAGHAGIFGNERADQIATSFALGSKINLATGTKPQNYPISVPNQSDDQPFKNPKYLSFVDGVFYLDETWPACESRVKGKARVKFKKVSRQSEVEHLKKSWA
jgi:ribonuclease HI